MSANKQLRICKQGHRYYKSSDCPVCPVCEKAKAPKSGYASLLAAPARRALENAGIRSLNQLAGFSEKQILQLHGIGRSSIPVLKKIMKEAGLSFQRSVKESKPRNEMPENKKDVIGGYIERFPEKTQKALTLVRNAIRETAPGATETIKYGMPAYVLKGNLVFFAGYKNHVGLYPVPVKEPSFEKILSRYKTGRGSVQFPLDGPMPVSLVKRIVKYYMKKQLTAK